MGDLRGAFVVNSAAYHPGARDGLTRFVGGVVGEMESRDPRTRVVCGAAGAGVGRPPYRVRVPWFDEAGTRGSLARLAWQQARLPGLLRREGAAAYFSPVPEGMLRPSRPQVVTVLDLIPLLVPGAAPRQAHYYRHVLPGVLRASAAVVAISRHTADDVCERFGVDASRVHVVHPGYDRAVFRPAAPERVEAARARHGLGEYVLAVGELRAYKNIRALADAFLRADVPGLQLAVVGGVGARDPGVLSPTGDPRIRFLGRVDDAELAALYTGARAFAFPSLYEGFGIPPLEAMACGCPVVASDAASIPEVCGDAAVYMDPRDPDDMARALREVALDDALRESLRGHAAARVGRFSNADAAERVLAVLRSVA